MKNSIKSVKNIVKNNYLLSFLTPLCISILVFCVLGMYPFGDNIYIRSDACHQYIRFLEFYKKTIYTGDLSAFIYSFSNGFGHSGMLYCAYYILSPFNIIVLLLPFLSIEFVFMIMIILKISLIGLSFYYFLEKFNFKLGKKGLLFSTAYSFTSFVTLYSMNIMWMESIILCPYLLVALKEMFETKKIFKFTIAMLILYISNFYMAFMVCLFLVILLIFYIIFDKNGRVNIFDKLKLFVIAVSISVLMFGIVMMPVIFELTEFYNSDGGHGVNTVLGISDIFSKLLVIKYDTIYETAFSGGVTPYIYFGVLSLLFALIYLLFGKNDADKKIILSTVLVFILSFMFSKLNIIWHGFENPTGFNHRYAFMFSFMGLVMAAKGLSYILENKISRKQVIQLLLLLFALIIVTIKNTGLVVIIVNVIFILIYMVLIYSSRYDCNWIHKGSIVFVMELVMSAIILNMMVNAQLDLETKNEYYNIKSEAAIENIVQKYSSKDYRILLERSVLPSVNTPMEYRYNGASVFNSSINFNFANALGNLGAYKTGELVYNLDSNYILDTLLSVKYIVSERELNLYEKIEEIKIRGKQAYIYENPYVLPIGFISNSSLNIDDIKSEYIESNILEFANSIAGEEIDINKLYKIHKPVRVLLDGKEIKPNSNGDYIVNRHYLKKRSVLRAEYEKGLDLVVKTIKGVKADRLLFIVKSYNADDSYRNLWSYDNHINKDSGVFELYTYLNEWESSRLNEANLGKLNGLELNETYMKEVLSSFKNVKTASIKNVNNGKVTMTIMSENDDDVLFTSIPYAKGWKAKLNGESVDIKETYVSTIGLSLNDGINEIELIYIPKGIVVGAIMTSLGVVFLLVRIKKFEQN